MTALIIILCIILFVFLLLLCPVTIRMKFENELTVKIRYLFIQYKIPHQKEKPEPSEETEKKEKEEISDTKSKIKDIIKQKGLSGFLNMIRECTSIATNTAKKLFSHLSISNISLDIAVSDEDAAEAAIFYGYTCSIVYPAMGMIVCNAKCSKYHISVISDFDHSESRILFICNAKIKMLSILSSALPALFKSLKVYKALKTNSINNQKTTDKAVH